MTFFPNIIYRVTKDGHYISTDERILILNPKEYQQDNGTPIIISIVQHPDIFIPIATERARSRGLHIPFAEIVSEKK